MSRRACVITGTRADYGLLKSVMEGIKSDSELELLIIATGMHLASDFGNTYKLIEEDGFQIDYKIDMLSSFDTPEAIAKSMGIGLIGFADALKELKPDLIVVLGDRFEIFSAVSAALIARIPVAHIHGGESTEGAFDEALRHSITKMSHLHFVATEQYLQRVVQLGEKPDSVFLVGGLGVDNINRVQLLDKEELEKFLKFKLGFKNLLVTFHPVTLENTTSELQMKELLKALSELKDTKLIFTLPNSDTDSRIIIKLIKEFSSNNFNAYFFESLGQLRYLSCIKHMDGVVGNSSSGLLEVPSFKKGTINIGDRQRGRIQAESVINCKPDYNSISSAIEQLYSKNFQSSLRGVVNPYGSGGASEKVVEVIREYPLHNIIKKTFYNLPSYKEVK
jgi:GDP/UDP-N,N'-diacetylbacillosamine 2-epimerase (hydrolysing)